MDIELIKAIGDLPVVAILIYLIVKQQGQIEKLMASICEIQQAHAKNMVDIILSGKVVTSHPSPTLVDTLQIPEK